MSIYTLHHQVRLLNETLCGNARRHSTGDVLFSDLEKRIVLGDTIAEGGEGSVIAQLRSTSGYDGGELLAVTVYK